MLKLSDNPPMIPDGIESLSQIEGEWWVAHTKARAEKALAREMLALSLPYFLPMGERTAIWGGRKRKVLTPVFPSYVFYAGALEDRQRVLATNRVCQVIAVKQRDQLVSELERIRIALASKCQLDLYPYAVVGQRCRVTKGPLEGIEGTIVRTDDVTRLVLQVSMLGQGASLEITADLLEPV
jgi:transcription antitermination factor NusG